MSCVEILAVKLRKYRAENKISREELAFRIGISVRHLNDIENMKCEVLSSTMDAIGSATGLVLMVCTEEEMRYYGKMNRAGVPIWKQFEFDT